jgi:hypothetical protein
MTLITDLTDIRDKAKITRDTAFQVRDEANKTYKEMLVKYTKDQELVVDTTNAKDNAVRLMYSALDKMDYKKGTCDFTVAQNVALSAAEVLSKVKEYNDRALQMFEATKAKTESVQQLAKLALCHSRSAQYALIVANYHLSEVTNNSFGTL